MSNALRSGQGAASMRARSFQCAPRSHARADDGQTPTNTFIWHPVCFELLRQNRPSRKRVERKKKNCQPTFERMDEFRETRHVFVWATSLNKKL
jgi:hypothetical protein